MKIQFDKAHNRLGTYSTQWDYIEDRFGKSDLLPFSISDTDFQIPEVITTRLHELADHGIFGYTRWNHDDFKGAIQHHFYRRWECSIELDWVLYSPSVLYSIAVLIRMLSKEGEGILVFDPMYDAFIHVIKQNKRELISAELGYDEQNSIDFIRLEEWLKQTKILLLCSPHNPTGKVFSDTELQSIIQLCKKYDVWIISDEIHADITLFDNHHTPVLSYYEVYEKMMIVSSASKVFNTPGLGGSYAILPNQGIYDEFLAQSKQRDFVNSANIMGMHALMVGYREADYYIDELVAYIEANVLLVKNYLAKHMPYIHYDIPQATYLAWLDVRAVAFDKDEIQKALIDIGGVAIMPGETYGKHGAKYLRMNLGCSKEKLMNGLNGMKKAFDSLMERGDQDAE